MEKGIMEEEVNLEYHQEEVSHQEEAIYHHQKELEYHQEMEEEEEYHPNLEMMVHLGIILLTVVKWVGFGSMAQ
jgi:putative methionine-R-sulfoxide reductase with GAF domain